MISRMGRGNFFAQHYDWLATGVGVLALLGVLAFCFVGTDVETEIDMVVSSASGTRRGKDAGGPELAPYQALTNTDEVVKTADKLAAKFVNSFTSEHRVFCDNPACQRAIPENFDADRNFVCISCGATQNVSKVAKVLDADGDGMTDVWERRYGLNPNDATDASQDLDGDGFTNLEEFNAKTNPKDAQSHPDYLDYLSIQLPLKETYVPFLFLSATKIPTGWRCTFFNPKARDDYGRAGRTFTATVGEAIGTGDDAYIVKSCEQKTAKKSIKGSVNTKEVDASEVVVERQRDGKQLTLVVAESRRARLTPVDTQATLQYARPGGKSFDVVVGTKFDLNGTKYEVLELKRTDKGALVTVEQIGTKSKRTLKCP